VGNVSVRQCRPTGYGTSWTAAIYGEVLLNPSAGKPYFYPDCETAQAAALTTAQAIADQMSGPDVGSP
jgi:hypothetical protein